MGTAEDARPHGAISLHGFTQADHRDDLAAYVQALEAFDALAQLQDLKVLARERTGTGPGKAVLDVGCGFGLETLRLARAVLPGGMVSGLDKSGEFVAEAERRAAAGGLAMALSTGGAEELPTRTRASTLRAPSGCWSICPSRHGRWPKCAEW